MRASALSVCRGDVASTGYLSSVVITSSGASHVTTRVQDRLSRLRSIASSRGGACLEETYLGAKAPHRFRCSRGHEWSATTNNVTRGNWCQKCAGRDRAEANFERIKERIRREHPQATILSEEYKDKDTPIRIRCENGHIWNARPNVISRGNWCRQCSRQRIGASQRCSFAEFDRLVRSKGGTLLTPEVEYRGNKSRVEIRCAAGHQWEVTVGSVRQQDSWCPRCQRVVVTLEDVRRKANENGGTLIDTEYTNAQTQMHFDCGQGHRFALSWNKVQGGRWCPKCVGYIGEELCRMFLERLFRAEFPKQRPSWLRGTSERRLELDGYNESLGIAFEHHGDHKFRAGSRFARTEADVAHLQARMVEKATICARQGVVLVEIQQVGTAVTVDDLPREILAQLREDAVPIPTGADDLRVTYADVHRRDHAELDRLRQIAQSKGGVLLSTRYAGSASKLDLRCREGHEWAAFPGSLRKGHWCGACAGRRKGTIEEMHVLAADRGFLCLSDHYSGATAKLRWRCSDGHEWENSPSKIRNGQGCPTCSGRRVTIEDCRELAEERGGRCLSSEYVGATAPMRWRCRNGHEFELSRNRVTSGRWCQCEQPKRMRVTIDDCRRFAAEMGGECLSTEYVSAKASMRWRCQNGHEFERSRNAAMNGRWCRCTSEP